MKEGREELTMKAKNTQGWVVREVGGLRCYYKGRGGCKEFLLDSSVAKAKVYKCKAKAENMRKSLDAKEFKYRDCEVVRFAIEEVAI